MSEYVRVVPPLLDLMERTVDYSLAGVKREVFDDPLRVGWFGLVVYVL